MLIKLTLEAIQENWEPMKNVIADSLAPTVFGSEEQIEYTYNALMQDKMQAWAMVENKEMVAVMITHFTGEMAIEVRNLLILALVSLKQLPIKDKTWVDTYTVLRDFAKKHKCHRIVAYTNEGAIIHRVTQLGGTAEHVLLTLEV
jgi:hypothetical protein